MAQTARQIMARAHQWAANSDRLGAIVTVVGTGKTGECVPREEADLSMVSIEGVDLRVSREVTMEESVFAQLGLQKRQQKVTISDNPSEQMFLFDVRRDGMGIVTLVLGA